MILSGFAVQVRGFGLEFILQPQLQIPFRHMASDLDIYRTASVLIREHGEDAALEAAQRADAMLEEGYLDGLRVWKQVLASIK